MMATFSGANTKKTTKQSVMQTSLSVIICTHNPRPEYFRRALESLHAQTMPFEQWELLIIDNASEELLRNTWDISWHPRGRHVLEVMRLVEDQASIRRQHGRFHFQRRLVRVDRNETFAEGGSHISTEGRAPCVR